MTEGREIAKKLFETLLRIDRRHAHGRRMGSFAELLIFRQKSLKLKMYQEKGHAMPHVHVDFGNETHVASYRIDPPCRLDGELSRRYDREVIMWIEMNRLALLDLWEKLQVGNDVTVLVAEISEP